MAQAAAPTKPLAQEPSDWVTFGLDLPPETRLVETVVTMQGIRISGAEEEEPTRRKVVNDVVIRRREKGFTVTVVPRDVPNPQDESASIGAMAEALRGMKLSYEFDLQGRLLDLRGLELPLEELSAALPPAVRPLLDKLLPAAMEQVKDEWRSRYADLVGARLPIGYTRRVTVQQALMPGAEPVAVQLAVSVRARVPCGKQTCVNFFMGWIAEDTGSFGQTLSRMMRDTLEQLVLSAKPELQRAQVRKMLAQLPTLKMRDLVNSVERVVDPRTLTVYREQGVRTFKARTNDGSEIEWVQVIDREFAPGQR